MTSYIQTRPIMRKFACGHVHVSQKVAQRDVFFTVNTVLRISKTNVLGHVFVCQSWIQRRVRKLKSSGGTSFRLQMWVVRRKRWCHMLKVTYRHVFISQKVCRHSSCSVRTCAWTRLVALENPKPTRITEFNIEQKHMTHTFASSKPKTIKSALRHQCDECRYVTQFKIIIILISNNDISQCSRYK